MNQETNKLHADFDADRCVKCDSGCCGKCSPRSNLHAFNWLDDVPGNENAFDIVEVHFKNTRRSFYRNSAHLDLKVGDLVAVEANPGHDIGTVAMTGKLVQLQMKRARLRPDFEILRIFRKAKPSDIERFEQAKAKEVDTMIRSRKIAADLNLKMKIGDVEYQGDGNKAIFYYIADERVDFRQLIKVLADVFKIRVEMKQIGARQEAGRIGGIGPCGRPLCCASWMTNFVSVATSAARHQDISLNPQKLAGQCAKLKCCINFEVDAYVEAGKRLPPRDIALETQDNTYYHFKTDIFKGEITYSTDKHIPANLVSISTDRAFEVIALNKAGEKPERLDDKAHMKVEVKAFGDIVGQDSISRFDKKKKKKQRKNRDRQGANNAPANNNNNNKKQGQEQRKAQSEERQQPQTPDARRPHHADGQRRQRNRQDRRPNNGERRNNHGKPQNAQGGSQRQK